MSLHALSEICPPRVTWPRQTPLQQVWESSMVNHTGEGVDSCRIATLCNRNHLHYVWKVLLCGHDSDWNNAISNDSLTAGVLLDFDYSHVPYVQAASVWVHETQISTSGPINRNFILTNLCRHGRLQYHFGGYLHLVRDSGFGWRSYEWFVLRHIPLQHFDTLSSRLNISSFYGCGATPIRILLCFTWTAWLLPMCG